MKATQPCPRCGVPHEFEALTELPGFSALVPICDVCEKRQSEAMAAPAKGDPWERLFRARIPAGYQNADESLVPHALSFALGWAQGAFKGGLGMIAPSGVGKSHAAAIVVRKKKLPFRWWSGTEAREVAIEAATADRDREGALRRWHYATTVPILVLDDISQGKMTEAWSSRLFDLLESRLSANLPTIWTSQIPLPQIADKIYRQNGHDSAQAEAITRRLGQHSLIVTV